VHTQDPSETERTRGARGEVAGDTRGILSPLVDPCDGNMSINASIAPSGLLSTHDKTVSAILTWQAGPASERRCLRTVAVHGRQMAA
jgi:hypothetical protein